MRLLMKNKLKLIFIGYRKIHIRLAVKLICFPLILQDPYRHMPLKLKNACQVG